MSSTSTVDRGEPDSPTETMGRTYEALFPRGTRLVLRNDFVLHVRGRQLPTGLDLLAEAL